MMHPKLRLAAARFALNLATTDDLIDASHAALDDAVYADGLAVIAATPGMSLWDATPHFTVALNELGHTFTSWDEALRYLRLSHFGPIAEGAESPFAGLSSYDRELGYELRYGKLSGVTPGRTPSAGELSDHWQARDYLVTYVVRNSEQLATEAATLEWDQTAIRLCCEWCREYAHLYLQPAWRSPTVLALAAGISAELAFDRLPVLADALEEAGCDHPDSLAHCRCAGPHVDYCWLVDAVLNAG